MYGALGFRSYQIGDVDVLYHQGRFHLFHLVLPNHDYIAHAVSEDGLSWRRVKNALFIGDPGAFDDDMLWTMHVSRDPDHAGRWRMFYTGLCRRERGRVQRVGLAVSDDLMHWRKVEEGFPLELSGAWYETSLDEGRHWVSFRDPYFVEAEGKRYLLAAARTKEGPVIRRGCVALLEESGPGAFAVCEPLYHPGRYDDVEVPNAFALDGGWYLIGSIREDVKVHYYYADAFGGPYRNFSDNVLLPQGNYAARVCRMGERLLVWNFFFRGGHDVHLLPPPKEIVRAPDGELRLTPYHGFNARVEEALGPQALLPLEPLYGGAVGESLQDGACTFGTESRFEVFLLQGNHRDFRLFARLEQLVSGKLGLVLRLEGDGNGYFISLELHKGMAQIRSWRQVPEGDIEAAFHYEQLQGATFTPADGAHDIALLAYGSYLELSLDGYVVLTLSNERFREGRVGFYTESATLHLSGLRLERLRSPTSGADKGQDPARQTA